MKARPAPPWQMQSEKKPVSKLEEFVAAQKKATR
jgi:hypothetical protein